MRSERRRHWKVEAEAAAAGPDLIIIDISHWQPEPDWAVLKNSGIVGVFMKATQGTGYTDDTFVQRRLDATAAGFPVASYHFLEHGSVDEQMAHYLDVVSPVTGERVVIDYEEASCTSDDLAQAVDNLLSDPRDLQVTVYGASKLTDDVRADDSCWGVLNSTSLWAARYSSNQPVVATEVWPTWTLWQFTDNATVPGISGPVDGNRFNGSVENCVKWFGPAGIPAPAPATRNVYVSIDADDGVIVTVKVNNQALK